MKLYTVEITNEDETFHSTVTGTLGFVQQIADAWNNGTDKSYTATVAPKFPRY